MNRVAMASTLISAFLFGSPANGQPVWQYEDIKKSAIKVFVDGIGATREERRRAYLDCLNSGQIARGEYETKAEFAARKAAMTVDCGALKTYDAYLEEVVSLKYDADNERFTFEIIGTVPFEGSNIGPSFFGGISVPKNFVLATCPLAAEKKWRNYYSIMTYGCPGSMFSASFFKGVYLVAKIDKISVGTLKGKLSHVNYLSVVAESPIDKARLLKSMERSLRIRLEGVFRECSARRCYGFAVKGISLRNLEDDAVLFWVR